MTDLKKRSSLKIMAGSAAASSLLVVPGISMARPGAGAPIIAGASGPGKASEQNVLPAKADLEISIIQTTAIPEQQVLLTNRTDELMEIGQFISGNIVFNEKMADLNSMFGTYPVTLEPGRSVCNLINIVPLATVPSIVDYVWAQDSQMSLSEETSVIMLGAYEADGRFIVFPLPEKTEFFA